jgi:hypothetical protein
MLYMTIFTYEPEKRNEVMKRRLEKGAMVPQGMRVIGEWSAIGGGRVFRLVQVENPLAAVAAAGAWSDLGKYEIVPVMDSEEAMRHPFPSA